MWLIDTLRYFALHITFLLRHHFLLVVVVVMMNGRCCGLAGQVDAQGDSLTWWNIGKFLREFVNTGLGANKLQEHLNNDYTWQNHEVDGNQRLHEINQRVSILFHKNIEVVAALKKVIEQEYHTWSRITRHEVNSSRLCCKAEQTSSTGCTLLAARGQDSELVLSPETPPLVLREMEHFRRPSKENVTYYFAFTDGSLFMYPSIPKEDLLACSDTYDPRLRYFFTQAKSPEPRDVVVVVDVAPGPNKLLQELVNRTFKAISLLDRVALCLPNGDTCLSRPLGQPYNVGTARWPREEAPLGTQSLLGRIVLGSQRHKLQLNNLLEQWLNTADESSPGFSGHVAALEAGLSVLRNSPKLPFTLITEPHHVIVYVTTRGGWQTWQEDLQLKNTLRSLIYHSVSTVINPILNESVGLEKMVLMPEENVSEGNDVTVQLVPFPTLDDFYSSRTSVASFGTWSSDQLVIPLPYWDAFGNGYILSVCLPLTPDGQFVGAVCTDDSIINILADTAVDDIHNAYVFMVNKMGKTILHPLLPSPHSLTEDPAHVTIDKLEREPELLPSLQSIVRQKAGYNDVFGMRVESVGRTRGTSQPSTVHLRRAHLRYLWVPLNNTDITLVLVLPLKDGKVMSSVYKCPNTTACATSNFQYHLPKPSITRNFCRFFGTEVIKNESLVKFAPDCFIDVLSYVAGEDDEQKKKIYSIFEGTMPYDELLSKDLRASVKLTEFADKVWHRADNLSDFIGLQFMGTADGTIVAHPGIELKQTYDHRTRPWYLLAVSMAEQESITMTTPYCDEWGAGMVYTVAKALRGPLGNPVAVVAGDFTLQYIMAHFLTQVSYCKLHTCLLVDRNGYVVLKTDWATHKTVPKTCANNTQIVAAHIIHLAPDLARDMIGSKILRRQGCHDYERDQTFYYWWLGMSGHRTLHKGPTYLLYKIPATNLFLVVRTERLTHGTCHCNTYPDQEFIECHDTCSLECECPCVSGPNTQPCHNQEADVHRRPLPACKPRGLTLVAAKNFTDQQLSQLEPCYKNKCNFSNETDCNKVLLCLWLGNEDKCQNVDTL